MNVFQTTLKTVRKITVTTPFTLFAVPLALGRPFCSKPLKKPGVSAGKDENMTRTQIKRCLWISIVIACVANLIFSTIMVSISLEDTVPDFRQLNPDMTSAEVVREVQDTPMRRLGFFEKLLYPFEDPYFFYSYLKGVSIWLAGLVSRHSNCYTS